MAFFCLSGGTARHIFRAARQARSIAAGAILAASAVAAPAYANPGNLVQNGDFSNTSAFTTYNGTTVGTNVNANNLPGWQLTNCASTSSACGFQFIVNGNLGSTGFYDAVDHHESTFYSTPGAAPDGNSNAFMSDASYQTQALYQAVGGLKIGDTYTLSFYQASLQQTGFSGAAQNSWQVGFGNQSPGFDVRQSATMNNASHGSTPWVQQTMSFVANATSEILYFFATSSAGAQPPFLLLDGVSLADTTTPSAVPEPATIALAVAGLVGMIAARRRRT